MQKNKKIIMALALLILLGNKVKAREDDDHPLENPSTLISKCQTALNELNPNLKFADNTMLKFSQLCNDILASQKLNNASKKQYEYCLTASNAKNESLINNFAALEGICFKSSVNQLLTNKEKQIEKCLKDKTKGPKLTPSNLDICIKTANKLIDTNSIF